MALGPGDYALLAAAGLAAGGVNAVAGGGSLISFPALVAVGLPTLNANVTNQVAVLPGYVGGSLAYREELRGQRRHVGMWLSAAGCDGRVVGGHTERGQPIGQAGEQRPGCCRVTGRDIAVHRPAV